MPLKAVLKVLGFGERTPEMTDQEWLNVRRDRERRMHSYILYVLLGGTFWAAQTLWEVANSISAMKPRIDFIEVQVSGSYTAREAARDMAELNGRIGRVEDRVTRLESSK